MNVVCILYVGKGYKIMRTRDCEFRLIKAARVVKIACCRIVGLMHIGAYTDC